jgi:hypothetical protein
MPSNQINVQPLPTQGTGSGPQFQGGDKFGGAWVSELFGKYYNLMKNGNIFCASCVPTGLAFPIYTSTTMAFTLWNPLGSGVDVIPLRFDASYVSGTGVVSGFGFGYVTGTGSAAATGGTVPTFTALTSPNLPTNGYLAGTSGKSRQALVGSACTLNAAPSMLRSAGFGQSAPVSAGTSIWPGTWIEFDQSIGLAPGSLLCPVGTAASVDLFWQSFIWAEVPQ